MSREAALRGEILALRASLGLANTEVARLQRERDTLLVERARRDEAEEVEEALEETGMAVGDLEVRHEALERRVVLLEQQLRAREYLARADAEVAAARVPD